jgi:hypothetical protein
MLHNYSVMLHKRDVTNTPQVKLHIIVKLICHFVSQMILYLGPIFTNISQYRLRFGFSLLYMDRSVLNCLTAQLSYEGKAAVERGK